MGKIIFNERGLIRTYECTCGGDCEPSEMGVRCYTCGAGAEWPPMSDAYNDMFDQLVADIEERKNNES